MHFMRKNAINNNLSIFEDTLGGSERLLSSPVPLFYSRHTARFLASWLLVLPLGLYSQFGNSWNHVMMIPATAFISVCLFGIEELATQLEEPFTILPMQGFCDKIGVNCDEIVSWAGQGQNDEAVEVRVLQGQDDKAAEVRALQVRKDKVAEVRVLQGRNDKPAYFMALSAEARALQGKDEKAEVGALQGQSDELDEVRALAAEVRALAAEARVLAAEVRALKGQNDEAAAVRALQDQVDEVDEVKALAAEVRALVAEARALAVERGNEQMAKLQSDQTEIEVDKVDSQQAVTENRFKRRLSLRDRLSTVEGEVQRTFS
jgi:hypothetical protein